MRLFFIILSQFLSGSIWFAANVAYLDQGFLLSAVQFGFILGTLIFAFLNISDLFSPARVFFFCALFGAVFNYSGTFLENYKGLLLMSTGCYRTKKHTFLQQYIVIICAVIYYMLWQRLLRFAFRNSLSRLLCGVSLAGIYPVGMKIAASWYPETVSKALGWLVGALVLATGFPYLIKVLNFQDNVGFILQATSVLCFAGGLIQLFLVGDGPHLPKGSRFYMGVVRDVFQHPGFRAASFGYFGHMWELYAVFAYIPLLLKTIVKNNIDLWSFIFFVFGFLGCSVGGIIALKAGSRKVALVALFISGAICLVSPFLQDLPQGIALIIIQIWGVMVVADSPQLSSLNTQFAPREYV